MSFLALALACTTLTATSFVASAQETQTQMEPLEEWSQNLVKETGSPAFGVAVLKDGKVKAMSIVGERAVGSNVAVEADDKWHLGSISKSITAAMIARLVDAGVLSWETTIAEALGGEIDGIHPALANLTFRELLTHRAGLAANVELDTLRTFDIAAQDPRADRLRYAGVVLTTQPAHTPVEEHVYSNSGYVVAAAMVEAVVDEAWEDLVKREVFAPLALTSAGFGPAGSASEIDQPRGHTKGETEGSRVALVPFAKGSDNPAVIRPAGGVHMNLADLGTYVSAMSSGALPDGDRFLSEESLKELRTPALKDYAMGWVVRSGGAFYWHNGSNGSNYAEVYFLPSENFVIAMTANDHDLAKLAPAFGMMAQRIIGTYR